MSTEIRIVLFADTHLGFDQPIEPRVERRRRGEDFFKNFQRVLDYAAKTRPHMVVHGGDLFFRSRLSPVIVDMVYGELLKFSEHNIPIFIVPGNHERSKLPPSLWLAAPNIHVFDEPKTYCLDVEGARIAVSGFPFIRENIRQQIPSVLAATGRQDTSAPVRLLCMHQTVEGAQVGPANYTFRSGDDVIKITDLPADLTAVFSGHIHRRQVLHKSNASAAVPVIYPGSTERTSFAEREEPKGFSELVLAKSLADKWRVQNVEFLELPSRPMVDIEIGYFSEPFGLQSYLSQKIRRLDEHSIVRIRCPRDVAGSIRGFLTAPFLRSVFPGSMNVQLSGALFRDEEAAGG